MDEITEDRPTKLSLFRTRATRDKWYKKIKGRVTVNKAGPNAYYRGPSSKAFAFPDSIH